MKDNHQLQSPNLYVNVQHLCQQRRITIAELERAAGLGNGVIRKWNTASPTLRTVIAVADYLNVTLEQLIRPQKQ